MLSEKRIGETIETIKKEEKKKLVEKIKEFKQKIPMTDKILEIIETYEDLSGARDEQVDTFMLGYKFACDGILKLARKRK